VYFVLRRRDVPFPSIFWLFGGFILACGTTHLMEAIIFWHPVYRLAGLIKMLTAVVSWGTVVALVPTIPKALTMRTPDELEREIAARKNAEAALHRANAELETRVQERTAELAEANASLRYEREMLRITLTSIGDAVVVTNTDGLVTFLNSVAQDLTGWKEEEAKGQPLETVFRIVNGQTRKTAENPAVRALKEGTIVGLANHTILIARDGTDRAIDDSAAPIRDEKGNVAGVVLSFRDVTEQRKAQRSARFLASIVESSDDAIIGKDMNGVITSWNGAAKRLFGYSAAEAVGRPIAILSPPDRADEMPAILARLKQGERVEHFDTVRRAKDGRLVPISLTVSPIKDEDGEIVGASKIARDISERKSAEEALHEEKERLHATLAGIGDAVVVTDAEGRVTLMNPVAQTLTGWKEEAAGRPLEEVFRIVNEQTRRPAESPVNKVMREGRVVGLANHTVLITKGGNELPIDDSAAPIRDGQGHVVGCVLVFRDVTERRRVERELAHSEARIRAVVDHVIDGIITIDEHGTVEAFNPGAEKLFGYKAEEVVGLNVKMLMPEPYHSGHDGYIANYCRTGQAKIIGIGREVVGRRKDGSTFPMELAVSEFWLSKCRYFTGIVRDITERKRAEEALRQSERHLGAELGAMSRLHSLSSRLVSATNLTTALDDVLENAILTSGADFGSIQLYNPESGALEIVAQRGFDQAFLDYFRTVRVDDGMACARAIQSGERVIIEDVHLDAAFEPHRRMAAAAGFRAVQSTPLKDAAGRVVGTLATHFQQPHRISEGIQHLLDLYARHAADFLQRLRFEETVKESERREKERAAELEAVMRAAPTPIWVAHDPQCHRITGNAASYALLRMPEGCNYSATPAEGKSPHRCYQEYRDGVPVPGTELPIQVAAAKGVEVNGAELSLVFDDGSVRHIFGNAVPLRASDGTVRGAIAAFMDITGLKEGERALKEADRRKDEFLATLAHELRNPLAPIRNAVQVLKAKAPRESDLAWSRDVIERQTAQMARLLDDLLDVSRITRNKLALRKEQVTLAAVVENAVESSRPVIDNGGHELTIALTPEPIYLDADRVRLAQVFANLLNNAAKYTNRGGHIRLTAERVGQEIVVSVRDTGIGFASDMAPRLFEMFTQANPGLERSQGGLGIGLSVVKGLVEMHGGCVEARSEGPGKGSEFIVRLPVAAVPQERRAAPAEVTKPSGLRCKIVVVDDNRDSADSLARLLKLMGHEVRTAGDGREALEVAESFRPDLVLLDIGMPELNGYEAARHIRRQPWGKDLLLVAQTGWGQEEDKRRALEAGFDHHLTKPVEPAAVQKLIAKRFVKIRGETMPGAERRTTPGDRDPSSGRFEQIAQAGDQWCRSRYLVRRSRYLRSHSMSLAAGTFAKIAAARALVARSRSVVQSSRLLIARERVTAGAGADSKCY
jgi:PAS domain S-box-containing protein